MPTRVTLLGSTGSIGASALEVLRRLPGEFEVVGLGARSSVETLRAQIAEFKPRYAALSDDAAAAQIEGTVGDCELLRGPKCMEELASIATDVVLCGMVGAAGLRPVLSAIDSGHRIALANKEPMVMAGALIAERARAKGVSILPVDSEHNAIFQCLEGHSINDVHKIHLTASGGPFYGRTRESLAKVTADEAVQHPTWDMGAKISVDSATLMNKGLEVIEAMWLFGLPVETVDVVIHPQSIVHGLVEFNDGSILAHLGVTDMTLPIQFALSWPKRVKCPLERLDLTSLKAITFAAPDFKEFPCLELALDAARGGGTAGAVLNAANEVAVGAFRDGEISFLRIPEIVRDVMDAGLHSDDTSLDGVMDADGRARREAAALIGTSGAKT